MSGEYYGTNKIENIPKGSLPTKSFINEVKSESFENRTLIDHPVYIKPQTSHTIKSEAADGAIATINNMIGALANSVNSLEVKNWNHLSVNERAMKKSQINQIKENCHKSVTAVIKGNSSVVINTTKKKVRVKKHVSSQSIKKITKNTEKIIGRTEQNSAVYINKKRVAKKIRPYSTNNFGKKSTSIFSSYKRKDVSTANLVELYHNAEVKESDSDEINSKLKTKKKTVHNIVPPLNISEKIIEKPITRTDVNVTKNIASYEYIEPQAPRTLLSYSSRNYQLPTISSRMKRCTKYYFDTLRFKSIPFCQSTSTTPSHNIGINIQQFINMVKTKQPLQNLSPTLAHNIGLAAVRLNGDALSSLVSTMSSKVGSKCPLVKSQVNYHHLQEIAKVIPEETLEENSESIQESSVNNMVITGPSGDNTIKNPHVTIWSKTNSMNDECTCLPNEGVGIRQIVSKQSRERTNKIDCKSKLTTKKSLSKPLHNINENQKENLKENSKQTGLLRREKNLKDVLTNLYHEFDAMTKKYDELSVKVNTEQNTESMMHELEKIETDLCTKEEEITMVMTLYNEVLALKDQVRSLKERTSQPNVVTKGSGAVSKFGDCSNNAAFHLTKLLKQIQQYQLHIKKDSNVC